jgi:hypothetical protein
MPCGTFNSSTMIVMMIAITPSLKASKRFLVIGHFLTTKPFALSADSWFHVLCASSGVLCAAGVSGAQRWFITTETERVQIRKQLC